MAEHLQEILLRGSMGPESAPKPWAEQNIADLEERFNVLRTTVSFMEAQTATMKDEMATIRIAIMEYKLGHVVRAAEMEGLGSNGLPKAKLEHQEYLEQMRSPYIPPITPRSTEISLPIATPGDSPVHFSKPYEV